MSGSITGQCLCGAVAITVAEVHDPMTGACHCHMCQRWSGGLFLCFEAQAQAVTVRGAVARYASSGFAERAFCPTCGYHLWMRDTDVPDGPYDLIPGLFEAARGWPLRSEIYTDQAMAAVALSGDHRRATRAEYEAHNNSVKGDA